MLLTPSQMVGIAGFAMAAITIISIYIMLYGK